MRCLLVMLCALTVTFAACDDGGDRPAATPTPRPLPPPVALADEPVEGFTLGDPSLEALPGATVDAGRLGGTIYQIEMPDDWNGRLVMYIHGNEGTPELQVYPPPNRASLIRNGFAWASSSFTVNIVVVAGQAADDSAALWDYFAQKYGRPEYSYVMGISSGGASTMTSAERYADRYDGALALCGDALPATYTGDFFVIAAFAAGITQQEYDTGEFGALIERARAAIDNEPAKRKLFEDIWIDQTGGPRPFDREGLRNDERYGWETFTGNIPAGFWTNEGRVYELGPTAGVPSEDFNERVIRVKPGAGNRYDAGNEFKGDIKVPSIAMQSTGDVGTPFNEIRKMRKRIDAAGKGELFVERAIRDARHCGDGGFTLEEVQAGLNDLVAWVEDGRKPEGEDLSGDLTDAGRKFTLYPRLGDDGADDIAGAGERVQLSGTITVDGQPIDSDAVVWVIVRADGFQRACSYAPRPWISQGRYELSIAAGAETPGCGAPGANLHLVAFLDGTEWISPPLAWPATSEATLDAVFTTAAAVNGPEGPSFGDVFGTVFYGTAFNADGGPVPAGTLIEAYIGDTRCGRYAVPPMPLIFDAPGAYAVDIPPPGILPACTRGEDVTFRIDGQPVSEAGVNDGEAHLLDLSAP